MKGKLFLTGMLGIILTFGLILVGCDKDDDGGGNNNSNDPITGTAWRSQNGTAANPGSLLIFSKVSGSTKYFYNITNVTAENTNLDIDNKEVTIDGSPYPYTQSGNTLTVTGYKPAAVAGGAATDVAFTRIEGSTNTGVYDVWFTSGEGTASAVYTVLVIKADKKTFTAVGNANWSRRVYTVNVANNRIEWTDGNVVPYTLNPKATELTYNNITYDEFSL
jgi:hypothetical protein